MNDLRELIRTIFQDFTVDGVLIPVSFLRYHGHETAYVTYMQTDIEDSLNGDDELIAYVVYFDFDIYSKGNFSNILEQIKTLMKNNGFVWMPERTSPDMFEDDTGYYHKTISFAYQKEV
jgi:hypothetical protein